MQNQPENLPTPDHTSKQPWTDPVAEKIDVEDETASASTTGASPDATDYS